MRRLFFGAALSAAAVLVVYAAVAVAAAPSKITICHKTASGKFVRTTVSSRAVMKPTSAAAHAVGATLRRVGDVVVVGNAACPAATLTPQPSSTPASKVTICHKTGSKSNPFRRIVVSSNAWSKPTSSQGKTIRGHMRHTGDMMFPGVVAVTCPTGTTTGGGNQGVRLTATLTPVSPATTGSGTATFTIRVNSGQLCYTLTVSGLTNVTAAHIHRASTGDIVVPLTAPTSGSSSDCIKVGKTLLQEIVTTPSAFYVNVHTQSFPNGQIRGTLTT